MKRFLCIVITVFFMVQAGSAQTANAPGITLESPYNTMYVHLYFLQHETYQPELAAVTLFRSQDSVKMIQNAIKLKQIFDGNGLFVRLNQLPQEKNFIDSTTQKPYYTPFPDELPDVYLEKIEGKWLFSKETISKIPTLHKATYPLGTDRLLTLLPKMGQSRFFGLALWQYLSIAILLLTGWLVFKILSGLLFPLIKKLISVYLKPAFLDNKNLIKIAKAISLLFLFWIIRILVPVLQLPIEAAEISILILRIIITVLAVVLAIRIIRLIMDYAMLFAQGTAHRMDEQVIPILRRSLMIVFVVIGLFHILRLLDVNIAALIAGVSIGGLALALAAQDTVKNLIGSAMIFFDRPFQIGDYIIGGGVEGTVQEVGFRATRLQTSDTSVIAVPNGSIANAAITNKGVRIHRLFSTNLGVTYNTPPDKIELFLEGLKQIILLHPKTKKEDFYVHLSSLDASSLNILFRTAIQVDSYAEELQAKESILFGILRLAESIKIDFAFPTSSVYVENLNNPIDNDSTHGENQLNKFLKDFEKKNIPPEDFLD